jgi:adenylate cyclase
MDPTLRTLVPSFRRHLLATNRSARTVQTYLCALDGLTRYLEAQGLPTEVRSIRRSHLEGFVAERRCPARRGIWSGEDLQRLLMIAVSSSGSVKSQDVCNNSSRLIDQLAISNAVSTSL